VSVEKNKPIVRRLYDEVFNQRKLDLADEIFASDHVFHLPSLPQEEWPPDAVKGLVALHCKLYPDIQVTVEEEVAEGERVVTSWTARGTLADELRSIDSGDGEVEASGVNICRVSDGQIRETWWRFDIPVDESQTPREEVTKFLFADDLEEDLVSRHAREFVLPSDSEDVALRSRPRPVCCMFPFCC
jgi:predicted SnoaL-like aldol condensation-catalyzing enzyme